LRHIYIQIVYRKRLQLIKLGIKSLFADCNVVELEDYLHEVPFMRSYELVTSTLH